MKIEFPVHVFAFIPPLSGFDGLFNTIRLGRTWAQRVDIGDRVLLMDQKSNAVFGMAQVTLVTTDKLLPICQRFGWMNHTETGRGDDTQASGDRVFDVLQKIYGPHICTPAKWATVIEMRRLKR